jgi:hypothetical protein
LDPLSPGAVGHAYSSERGTLIEATAVSREPYVADDIEIGVAAYAVFPMTTRISASAHLGGMGKVDDETGRRD